MLLYCIRHGESTFNAQGRIQGQANPPLSDLGMWQSEALAAAFATIEIDAVYASPLERAAATARPLAAALGLVVRPLDGLMELNAGIFQGKSWHEIHDEHPQEAALWASHDPDYRIPGGESRRDLMLRGHQALETIRSEGSQRAAVVSHGGILAAALKSLLGIPAERNPFSFYNASISQVNWDAQVKLLTLNQIDHLRRAQGEFDTRSGDL
jgi:probable phosphoglycerate mutase